MTQDKSRHSNRLEALPRIVREADAAPDLDSALRVIVRRTREVMAAGVCSVYFTEHEQRRHVFAATDGLPPELVGQVPPGRRPTTAARSTGTCSPLAGAGIPGGRSGTAVTSATFIAVKRCSCFSM